MIDLYTWTTPNGRKVSILLEELGLPYTAHAINIGNDEQFAPDFLKISPNNKIPAIVDHDNGMTLMESGAIMIYLADKTGKFLAHEGEARYRALEWLMWQMGGAGPMLGQVHHFSEVQPRQGPLCPRSVSPREARRLYGRARQAPRGGAVSGRRVLDCRYRHMAMDLAFRMAADRPLGLSEPGPLVRRDRRARGSAEGVSRAQRKWAISLHGVSPGRVILGTWFCGKTRYGAFFFFETHDTVYDC